ncbi:hypothetical protein [Chitinophaga sp. CF418]|uniref:hypothetical protein n=1 Tax=Chitinophaga sp. CF418 TaxID=1855287 RepID=UPI00091F4ECF|nr:hypothetical protein [Chitinophaga sp. CF418]SHN43758.1 hypothetical protein SAMN05216311_11639 [Chitinophaga sp. CF418]
MRVTTGITKGKNIPFRKSEKVKNGGVIYKGTAPLALMIIRNGGAVLLIDDLSNY